MLEQNYRSTQTILDAAQNVVRRNRLRKDKRLWTALGTGEKVILHEAYNEEEEGLFVAREIARLLARGEIDRRGDVAVMYRTNAQTRALEEQFLRANIPYKVIGSRKFYERKEIKDMLAYLRLLANPHDDLSLQRIINVPNRKIGPKTLGELQLWASEKHVSLYEAVQQVELHPTLGKAAKTALAGFAQLLTDLTNSIEELPLPELLDRTAERSGYGPELRESAEGEERWSNVLELRRVADDYSEIETRTALELFLENVALVGGADTAQTSEDGKLIKEENGDAVTLITLHAAKGLEYPIVFIVGMDEGSLPHARSVDKPEQLEEERRLAYVGFTRAMRRLYLVRAYRRSFFGETHITEPSRFLEDIPIHLVYTPGGGTGKQSGGLRSAANRNNNGDDDYNQDTYSSRETGRTFGSGKPSTGTRGQSSQWTTRPSSNPSPKIPPSLPAQKSSSNITPPTPPTPAKPKGQQFKPGDRVLHDKFGEGTILKSEMQEDTEFVEVQFGSKFGKKRLSMDFAKLEKL
jgi:DNA helicase-2/ATP-dependent DNA helicase PcrA